MKNKNFINQSLWAGSSPNQTGETLTRQNRIGVKSWLNRGLMLLITILTLGVGQMWAANVFMKPSSDWTKDGAWSAAYFYVDSNNDGTAEHEYWESMTSISGTDLYTCAVPTNYAYEKVIFVRMGKDKPLSDHWNAKWNQTGNLDIEGANKYCEISGYGDTEWKTLPTHPAGKVIYMKPCSNWKDASARFAAYFYGSDAVWRDMTVVDGTGGNYYSVTVPTGTYPFVIFCRMKGDVETNSFANPPCWAKTKDIAPDASDASHNIVRHTNNTYETPTTDWWDYSPVASLIGDFNSWDKGSGVSLASGSAEVTLSADLKVGFKILDGETWHGNTALFVGQSGSIIMNDDANDCHVITGDAGKYLFTYNSGTQALTVGYPDTHPNSHYVYFKNTDSWSTVYAHRWDGTDGNTSWPGWGLGTVTIGNAEYAFMPTYGAANFIFNKNEGTGDKEIKTPTLSLSTNAGKQYTGTSFVNPRDGSWSANFPITITLNKGDHGVSNGTAEVNYNATSLTSSTPVSANEGYTLEGYYNGSTKVLKADLTYAGTSVGEYISGGKWVKNKNCTLTAEYTLNSHDLTWSLAGGSITSESGTYTAAGSVNYGTTLTAPTVAKEGYSFAGWSPSVPSTMPDNDVTYTATWADDHNYYFNGATEDWNTASNWTKGAVPNDLANTIYILKPVEIPAGTTIKAAEVNIVTSGTYTRPNGQGTVEAAGHLSIAAGAELIISGELRRVADATAMATKTNTREDDLHIGSDGTHGNGALVMGTHDGTNQAIVEFYTKSHGDIAGDRRSYAKNQFVGTPFNDCDEILYNYHNSWVYEVDYSGALPAWKRINAGDGMDEFKGYDVISADPVGHVYWMGGTLVASANQSIDLQYKGGSTAANENVLANSWVAPIQISAFLPEDFVHADATIYIFNSGSPEDVKSAGAAAIDATTAGQWITIPINSGSWGGKTPTVQVIPSMQSFSVYSTEGSATLELDYNRLVYTPAVNGTAAIVPNRAPKRYAENEEIEIEDPEVMRLFVSGESGFGDNVIMLAHEAFTNDFDNGWDGRKVEGESVAPQMAALTSDGKMAYNCVPEMEGTIISFVKGNEDANYTFSFEYEGENIWYLNDQKEQKSTLISEMNRYEFTSSNGDNVARFVISRTPIHKVPTGMEDVSAGTNARKQMINGVLYIIRDGRIYNAEGALVK